jgi:hypothetical protein
MADASSGLMRLRPVTFRYNKPLCRWLQAHSVWPNLRGSGRSVPGSRRPLRRWAD